ncbi:helix-turn-helix domain-containing protein [Flavobacterium sp. WC2509]|uniref:helix-turn-helix domain-containing protein n=1 Tax=Flavobacterium sp. WC2509 TaxID=3461406 RepID=UPI004044E211
MDNILAIIIPGACLMLVFMLFINIHKANINANKWLTLFVLCLFIQNSNSVLFQLKNNSLYKIIEISSFFISPLFYLSVSSFINPTKKWRPKCFLHFGLAFLFIVFTFFLKPSSTITSNILGLISLIFNCLIGIQVIGYCYLCFKKITKHQKDIKLFSSAIESVDLKWLKNITLAVIFLALYWATGIIFQVKNENEYYYLFLEIINLFIIFYIAYYSLKQKEIYPYSKKDKKELKEIIIESLIPEENRKKIIEDEKLEFIKSELLQLMQTEKPFLDCELSLIKLASKLNITSHQLSYAINSGFHENFYQFVNRYRIEEAKKLLSTPEMNYLNLLGIAFEVGFNSKTVFNTTFKKVTGKTPSEFKKSCSDL